MYFFISIIFSFYIFQLILFQKARKSESFDKFYRKIRLNSLILVREQVAHYLVQLYTYRVNII